MPEINNKETSKRNSTGFSVIIPAYNEEKNITNTLEETSRVFKELSPDFEIIVVDDGSFDSTYETVKEYTGAGINTGKEITGYSNKIKIERYVPNQGKGYALKYGFNFAQGKYVVFLDADLDLHPGIVKDMFRIMQEKQADVVIGSKMHKESVLHYPFLRKLASFFYYIIIKALFRLKIKDTQTGIKLFKYDVLADCMHKVLIKRYAFDLELLVAINKKGYKILEAPVCVNVKRQFGRVGIRDAFKVFIDTIGVFRRLNFRKYYG